MSGAAMQQRCQLQQRCHAMLVSLDGRCLASLQAMPPVSHGPLLLQTIADVILKCPQLLYMKVAGL